MVSKGGVDSFRFRGLYCPSMIPAVLGLFAASLRTSSFIRAKYRPLSASGLRRSALYVPLSRMNSLALRASAILVKADESTPTERMDWKKSRVSKGVCSVAVAILYDSSAHRSRERCLPATKTGMGARLKILRRSTTRKEIGSSRPVTATIRQGSLVKQ